jgi:hypothetical protein
MTPAHKQRGSNKLQEKIRFCAFACLLACATSSGRDGAGSIYTTQNDCPLFACLYACTAIFWCRFRLYRSCVILNCNSCRVCAIAAAVQCQLDESVSLRCSRPARQPLLHGTLHAVLGGNCGAAVLDLIASRHEWSATSLTWRGRWP